MAVVSQDRFHCNGLTCIDRLKSLAFVILSNIVSVLGTNYKVLRLNSNYILILYRRTRRVKPCVFKLTLKELHKKIHILAPIYMLKVITPCVPVEIRFCVLVWPEIRSSAWLLGYRMRALAELRPPPTIDAKLVLLILRLS